MKCTLAVEKGKERKRMDGKERASCVLPLAIKRRRAAVFLVRSIRVSSEDELLKITNLEKKGRGEINCKVKTVDEKRR